MAFQYKLNEFAHKEFIDAYEWYEIKQKGLGDTFMHAIQKQLQQISQQSGYYSKLKGNFRSTKIDGFPFIIVYEFFPRKRLIHIAAIYHTRRHPKHKFRKDK